MPINANPCKTTHPHLQGELDYAKLKGDTGPLVYPAGFVYLFAALRRLTGGSVVAAQVRWRGRPWLARAARPRQCLCCSSSRIFPSMGGCLVSVSPSACCTTFCTSRSSHSGTVSRIPPAPTPCLPHPHPQYIFAALYLATQAVVMALYARTAALPPWSLALLCASRRLHSIFVLRLFNDCWAMFVAYGATLALQVSGRAGEQPFRLLGWPASRCLSSFVRLRGAVGPAHC